MTSPQPIVGLQAQSRPQILTLVRGMLSGVAEQLAMDPELLDDLRTSVSEACNNVVMHAYGGEPGPMDVRLFVDRGESLAVSIEDRGVGLSDPPAAITDGSAGLGVSVMQALARELELIPRRDGGTEVVMRFDGLRDQRRLFTVPPEATPDHPIAPIGDNEVTVTVSPTPLLSPVLGRVARTLAATAHFSLDRFSDIYLITEALAGHATRAGVGDRVSTRLRAFDRRLELSIGPFRRGSGERLERGASPLSLLADQLTASPCGEHERIELVVIDESYSAG